MIINTILFLTISVLLCTGKGLQHNYSNDYVSYNRSMEEVRYLLYKGDSLSAETILTNQIFTIKRPFLRDIRNLIKLRIEMGKLDSLDELVKYSFQFGMSKEFLNCNYLISRHYEKQWDDIFPEYLNVRNRYLSTIDTSYRNTIIELLNEDQKYRTLSTEKGKHIDSLRKANDAMVLLRLKKLIESKGYFGFSKIGEDILWGNNCFNFTEVFFSHIEPDSNRLYFYPILLDALHNGDLYAMSYATIVDYDWIKSDSFSSLYGTVNFSFKGDKFAFPLIQPEKIDSLRNSIGLIDWQRDMEMTGFKYDPNLKPWEW